MFKSPSPIILSNRKNKKINRKEERKIIYPIAIGQDIVGDHARVFFFFFFHCIKIIHHG
jgi:hypothetical protein